MALTEQEGVKSIILSGMRATVVMEEGKALNKEKVADAFGAQKLKLVSMEVVERPAPVAMYNLRAKGIT